MAPNDVASNVCQALGTGGPRMSDHPPQQPGMVGWLPVGGPVGTKPIGSHLLSRVDMGGVWI